MSRVKHTIILQCVLLLVSLSLLEVTIRLFHLAPGLSEQWKDFVKDDVLPFKPRPFGTQTGHSASGEFDFEYKHNSLGLRDEEHPLRKSPGSFRILGIGDSFSYGAGAPYTESYLFRLEALLNGRSGNHPHIEIVKAGIPRYWAEPERLFLQYYGKLFSPDLILVQFHPNDLLDTYFGIDAMVVSPHEGYLITRQAGQLGSFGTMLYLHSHLARLFLNKYIAYRIQKEFPVHWPDLFRANGYHEKEWSRLESEYSKMALLAQDMNARMVLIQIPFQPPWDSGSDYPGTRLGGWCEAHQTYFVDCLPALKAASKSEILYWKRDGHCNGTGYRVVAETAFDFLTTSNLVP